jgi:hypothetical protein
MLRKLLPYAWVVLIYLTLVLIALALTIFIPALRQYLWGMIILVLIVFAFARKYFDPFLEVVGDFRKGKRGEEKVLTMLKESLDNDYTYVENYIIPNTRIGDIDGLLIGPKGVIVLEVKNYQGTFRVSGSDLYRRNRGDNHTLYRKSPFAQAIRQKNYLLKHFKDKGISNVSVRAVVVFPEARLSSINGEIGVFVTENYKLVNRIFQFPPVSSWNPELKNKVINSLGIKTAEVI